MKNKVLFLLVFAMLMSIVMVGTAFAKEVYTVSVAVEYNDEDKLAHYDINQVSGNVVYDKMASLGAKYYLTEFDPEGEREIITAIFEKPVDIDKVEDSLKRVPGFEIRDFEGNVLMDETHLSNASVYTRILWDDYDKTTYYINAEYDGIEDDMLVDKHPGIKSALTFSFTDEGEARYAEILKELSGRKEGENCFYLYINEKFIASYKAPSYYDGEVLKYIGKSDEEHDVLSTSIRIKGEYLMPKSTEIVSTGGPYEVNCSDWAFDNTMFMLANGAINLEDNDDYTKPITRGEFCTYAAKIIIGQTRGDIDVTEYESKFKDTKSHEVAFLNSLGIINGKGYEVFAPDDLITREEASAILFRMCKHLIGEKFNPQGADSEYSDDRKISSWARKSVYSCTYGKIMLGMGDGSFNPGGTFTTEQAFTTFKRIALKKAKTEPWYNAA